MTITYRFTVTYQTRNFKQASDFIKKCDLNIGGFYLEESLSFKYTKEEKPIQYFKDLIKQAYEACDCVVNEIKGGKIE